MIKRKNRSQSDFCENNEYKLFINTNMYQLFFLQKK